ncbi:hypothetical protein BTA51_02145 [Hahella sp. CCB-MM4]|uniref:hypothetical protein n=1 Tax=Hahella sp. (strain CCB-MM4) TaxID=1926491 RepID=UPI000BD48127|nr:hypothetical protein [Hahella sp. CCB-MM4]OZG75208.1 hypothetical protein BTA51_02145 [Hahella sp. CCB-MM4]
MSVLRLVLLPCLIMLLSRTVMAEKVELMIGLTTSGGGHYFVDLLEQSLKAQGYDVSLRVIEELPQSRVVYMVTHGDLSLTWLLQTKERDESLVPVHVGLTNGLIGHRVLLIPPEAQSLYDQVNSLADFRTLGKVGVFGKDWFDVKVWKYNQLKYFEREGSWEKAYKQVASGNRGVDYFSRGIFEVVEEADQHPYLKIEEHLLFVYDRDFLFYLSSSAAHYKQIIEESLIAARDSGLMQALINKHWETSFDRLALDKRVRLNLNTPSD